MMTWIALGLSSCLPLLLLCSAFKWLTETMYLGSRTCSYMPPWVIPWGNSPWDSSQQMFQKTSFFFLHWNHWHYTDKLVPWYTLKNQLWATTNTLSHKKLLLLSQCYQLFMFFMKLIVASSHWKKYNIKIKGNWDSIYLCFKFEKIVGNTGPKSSCNID